MRIIGVDLHTRQQSVAMLDTDTGEVIEKTLEHEGDEVREFYSALPGPVLVGIEATGSMPWFLKLMEELKIECLVGHPAKVRAAEARKQKHDRRDARLLPTIHSAHASESEAISWRWPADGPGSSAEQRREVRARTKLSP